MTEKPLQDTVEFIDSHQPKLTSGDYTISVSYKTQTTRAGPGAQPGDWTKHVEGEIKAQFSILGPRFRLDPQDVLAVFPPPGSSGEHSDVLPHIILRRSTLPWERSPGGGKPGERPWLALLVFGKKDVVPGFNLTKVISPETMTLEELMKAGPGSPAFPKLEVKGAPAGDRPEHALELEYGDHLEDQVTCIDVPRSVLEKILPSREDLRWLAHVRKTTIVDPDGKAHVDEAAVIMANRLPEADDMSIVHLVSLEGRYGEDGFDYPSAAGDESLVRLVSLKSWRFTCLTAKHSFSGLLRHLNQRLLFAMDAGGATAELQQDQVPETLRQAFEQASPLGQAAALSSEAGHWTIRDGDARYLVNLEKGKLFAYRKDSHATLRRPPSGNADADKYLAMGCVPLQHHTRQGNQTVSWYRGPLAPGRMPGQPGIHLPVRVADELMLYDPEIDMLDVSLAAAWELGRLLTLKNKRIALGLFNWKRAHAQALKDAEQQISHLNLTRPEAPDQMPEPVLDWFKDLALLRGVPFYYLVPDELLLPPESLRFFQIDPLWMECLLDGAFSIGRVLAGDRNLEPNRNPLEAGEQRTPLSGFLLRSELVEGYPDLRVEADGEPASGNGSSQAEGHSGASAQKPGLALLRSERLAKDVLFCLFDGLLSSAVISLKPERMHFGIDRGDQEGTWYKTKRAASGDLSAESQQVPFRDGARVVCVNDLASALESSNPAQFALQMIEGAQAMRFYASS